MSVQIVGDDEYSPTLNDMIEKSLAVRKTKLPMPEYNWKRETNGTDRSSLNVPRVCFVNPILIEGGSGRDELIEKAVTQFEDGTRAQYRQEPSDGHECAAAQLPEDPPAGGGHVKSIRQPPNNIVCMEVHARFKCGGCIVTFHGSRISFLNTFVSYLATM
ncbi:hypothetical protein PIB30_058014 [Stylosanthes scabra]|uniref:Uncharacterized protein n=1 Tax=Stylosanthes scabra TaxID=79078 RepID=A0ABU6QJA4_9FABA|nr:hypothetical protein [Stylosanthes scabra]